MIFKRINIIVFIFSILFFIIGMMFSVTISPIMNYNEQTNFWNIFSNNISSEMSAIFLGSVTIGIYSTVYLFMNFMSMGVIVSQLLKSHSLIQCLNMFIYHGFFEIPAIVFTTSLGIYIPYSLIKMLKTKTIDYKSIIKKLIIIIVLTFIAAFIETKITPIFMR